MRRHHFLLLLVVVIGCCKAPPPDSLFDDPVQASARVRALVTSCAGLTRALAQLAHAHVRGRLLAGLVDDAIASATCADKASAVKGTAAVHQLARARLDDARPEVALADLADRAEVAVRYRRAELLDRLGRTADAAMELDRIELDADAQALQRLVLVSVAARTRNVAEVGRLILAAPLPEQPRLSHRAAADAPLDVLTDLAQQGPIELAIAVADRAEPINGPMLGARERIAHLDPTVAEHWDALGRARMAEGDPIEAVAAWDRAIELAPAQPAFRVAPIRALMVAGDTKRARFRAEKLANDATRAKDVELLVTASSGAAVAGDTKLAVALARDARKLRSTDGRLAFLVAQRLAEAGDVREAAAAYSELLVCGAHGRAWHRHEVMGKLIALATSSSAANTTVRAAIDAKQTCETAEPQDLATYLDGLPTR